jgi:hypothetical protein
MTGVFLLSESLYYFIVDAIVRVAAQAMGSYEAFHNSLWTGASIYTLLNLLRCGVLGLCSTINTITGALNNNQAILNKALEREMTEDDSTTHEASLPPPYWVSHHSDNLYLRLTCSHLDYCCAWRLSGMQDHTGQ